LITVANRENNAKVELSVNKSLLAQVIDWLSIYFSIVKERPGYVMSNASNDVFDSKENESYWEDMVSALGSVFKQVASGLTEMKSRSGQKAIKAIFTDIATLGDGHMMIENFFKGSLSQSLEAFVRIIEEPKMRVDELKKAVSIINTILKSAKNNAK
jgi:uncharacterized protein YicC (UPF0701 family)